MARNKKHENDKFYTKAQVVDEIISIVDVSEYDYIIEPSAGNGSFYNKINSTNKVGIDLVPECSEIIQCDWFDFKLDKEYKKILVIGNPPFGKQGSLALKFIKKCVDLRVDTIAFILPKSFKKDSLKNKIPLNYHLIKEIDLPDDSFTLMGKSYSVPCVFQLWKISETSRAISTRKTTTKIFEFVKKNENPTIAFRRVGFYAGKIYTDYTSKSEQSHYFIKCDKIISDIIENLKWDHNNTAGPRSIGKSELIEKVEKVISNQAKDCL